MKYTGPCLICKIHEKYSGRFFKKMCRPCYERMKTTGNATPKTKFIGPCVECGATKPGVYPYFRRQRCTNCYKRTAYREKQLPSVTQCVVCSKPIPQGKKRITRQKCYRCYKRERYHLNKSAHQVTRKRYSQSQKGKQSDQMHRARRRALYKQTESTLTTQEWRKILDRFGYMCAYCDALREIEMDHVVPLSRGGTHTADNVVPACMTCNRSKGDKLVDEWINHPGHHSST